MDGVVELPNDVLRHLEQNSFHEEVITRFSDSAQDFLTGLKILSDPVTSKHDTSNLITRSAQVVKLPNRANGIRMPIRQMLSPEKK